MAYKAPQIIPQDKLDALAAYNKNKKDKKAVDNSTKGGYTYTDEDKGITKEPGGYEYTKEEWDEIRDRSASTKPTTLKNEKYKPAPKSAPKPDSKPMKEGDYGTVNSEKNSEAMGPNMGKVNKESDKAARDFTATEMAQNLMSPGYNKKKGGKITTANYDKEYGKIYRKAVKNMSSGGSVSSASKRADGCAVRGKTKGKMC